MKSYLPLCLAATLGFAASVHGQTPAPAAAPATTVSFQDALTKGKASLTARLRYERVEQDNALADADAFTLMTRLGYTTLAYHGFQGSIELEHITAFNDNYSDGTPAPVAPAPSVVADPEITQLNQAWLSYTFEKTKGTIGRQKLVLDNARFIGDVGWRQNNQTFDAFVLQDKTVDKLTLTYAYLDEIHRIFDDSAPQPDWESDSHVINASYAGLPFGTLTGYAYLLDFDNSAVNSSATYGLSFAGATAITKALKATYRLEYATQSDYADNTASYDADYYLAEAGLATKKYSAAVGYEVLGSDGGVATQVFRTPLATLHAFNGWADMFLITPAAGLTDLYFKASAALPYDINILAFYHKFESEEGSVDYGDEIDLQVSYKVNKNLSLLAKAASYKADAFSVDTDKFSIQADYSF